MNKTSYPVVQFLVSRGRLISFLLALAILLTFVLVAFSTHLFWVGALGVVVAGLCLGLLLSYVEVLEIIADTLLPKY